MVGVLKLNTRALPNTLNKLTTRYFSRCNKVSQLVPTLCQNKSFSFLQQNQSCWRIKNDLCFNKMILIQSRGFSSSGDEQMVVSPPFPESVAVGDIRWEKEVGDSVRTDEVVCEIETDKTSIPVPAPANGVILEKYVAEGGSVKAGQNIFRMKFGDVPQAEAKPAAKSKPAPAATVAPPSSAPPPPPPPPPSAAAPSTPTPAASPKPPPPPKKSMPVAAIKHAQAIEAASVLLPPSDPSKQISGTRSEYRVKMNRMRQRIAQRLKEAQNVNAMLTTFNEIDMSALLEFRKAFQDEFIKKHGVKLGIMSPFIKASAYALQLSPIVNAVIVDNEVVYRDYIDISIAVATPKGLVVPVLRNVQSMNFGEIESAMHAMGERARTGKITVEEMDGGTFTISNGGVFGSLMGTPIINPPQSAILGMHSTVERPVAIKGQVVIRPMMYVALTYDHRLIDGREAVLFLRKIKSAIEDPRIMLAGI